MSYFTRSRVNWEAVANKYPITPEIRQHLVNVYTTLSMAILSATLGSVFFLKTHLGGTLSFFAAILCIVWLVITPREEVNKRLAILCGFAFLKGCSIGPLIESVIEIDPAIVTSAFLGTSCIFLCFSATAYFAERRSYLFLGGFLSSALSALCLLSFVNIFFRSLAVFNLQVYGGLLLFCGFVIFDTQLIIEKAANGSKDYVWDSLELFLDFLNIFVRLLIILAKNSGKKSKRSNR